MRHLLINVCWKGFVLLLSLTLMACSTSSGDPNSTLQYQDIKGAAFGLSLSKPEALNISEQQFIEQFQAGLAQSDDWRSVTLLPKGSHQTPDFLLDIEMDTYGVSNFVRDIEYGQQEMHHFTTATRLKGRTLIRDTHTHAILWQYRWTVENYDYQSVSRFVYEDNDLLQDMNNKAVVRVVGQSPEQDQAACVLLKEVCRVPKSHGQSDKSLTEPLVTESLLTQLFGAGDPALPFPEHESLLSMTHRLGRHLANQLPQP